MVSYTFAAASTVVLTFETNKRQTTAEAFVCSPNEAAAGGSAVYCGSQQYLSTSYEISRRTTPTAAPPAAAAAARAPCSAAATQIIPLFVVVQRNHLVRVHLAEFVLRLHLTGVHLFVVTTRCINICKASAFAFLKFWRLGFPVWLLLASCAAFAVHFLEFIGLAAFASYSAL